MKHLQYYKITYCKIPHQKARYKIYTAKWIYRKILSEMPCIIDGESAPQQTCFQSNEQTNVSSTTLMMFDASVQTTAE